MWDNSFKYGRQSKNYVISKTDIRNEMTEFVGNLKWLKDTKSKNETF